MFAEGLGVRICVGPADAGGASASGFDQFVGAPFFAKVLGLGCQRRSARCAEFFACVGAETAQLIGLPACCFGVAAQAARCGHFFAPAETKVEWAFAHEFFGRIAATVACHVTGADGHQVGGHAEIVEGLGYTCRPEQVDLDGGVERGVERHGGG